MNYNRDDLLLNQKGKILKRLYALANDHKVLPYGYSMIIQKDMNLPDRSPIVQYAKKHGFIGLKERPENYSRLANHDAWLNEGKCLFCGAVLEPPKIKFCEEHKGVKFRMRLSIDRRRRKSISDAINSGRRTYN